MTTLSDQTRTLEHPSIPDDHERRWTGRVNVGNAERTMAGVVGAALALYGIQRRTLPSGVLGLLGGALIYRAASGHCPVYKALGIDTADMGNATEDDFFDHGIHVEESFTI